MSGSMSRLTRLVGAALLVLGCGALAARDAQAADTLPARMRPLDVVAAPRMAPSRRLDRLGDDRSLQRLARPAPSLPKAQWQVCDPCARKRRWSAVVGPYGWLASVSGSAWNAGERTDFDISFDQILELTSGGFMLYAEVGFDRWFASFDGTWAVLQSDFPWALGTVGFKQKQTILEGRIGYRLFGPPHGTPAACRCSPCAPPLRKRLLVDLYVGARYWDSETTVRVGLGPFSREITSQESWIDGLIGIRVGFHLSPHWSLAWRNDLAGFDIQDSSTLTAFSFLGFRRRLGKHWSLALGYRAMLLDRTEGTGGNRNGVKTVQQGPLIGLLYNF